MDFPEDDETSAIEELVSRRLNSWADSADSHPAPSAPACPKKSPKKRRRKVRRQASGESTQAESDQLENLKAVHAASLEDAAQRVLQRTIIRPHVYPAETASPKNRSSALSTIIVAGDLGPGPRKKKSKGKSLQSHQSAPTGTQLSEAPKVDAAQFVDSHRREVGRFGSRALDKRERKSFDAAELIRLGCRPPKNNKIPIGLLIRKRQKQKVREAKKKEMDLATGMLVRSKRK